MNGRYTFYQTLIVVFTLLGLLLLWELAETVVVLLGAIIFASAIRPMVQRLCAGRVPTGLAILLVYLGVFGALGLLLAFSLPPLYAVLNNLINDNLVIRRITGALIEWSYRLGYERFVTEVIQLPVLWNEWRGQLGIQMQEMARERGWEFGQRFATGLGQLLLGLAMSFYWLTARDQIQGQILSITPVRHRGQLEMIFNDVERTLGDYVRGTAILMLSIGVSAFVGLLLLRVPNALALAVLAGLFEAVPMVGATIGALPAVLVAFSVSPTTGVLTILLFVVIQFLENNVLVPRVMERSVGLNPLLVIIAIVAGGSLNGMVGALLAIPVAGALQVIVRYLVVEPMQQEASQRREEGGLPVFDAPPEGNGPVRPSDIVISQS